MNVEGRSFQGSVKAGGGNELLHESPHGGGWGWGEREGRSELLLAEECHFGCCHWRDELIITARDCLPSALTDRRVGVGERSCFRTASEWSLKSHIGLLLVTPALCIMLANC